jgi:hypothetical protein
MAIARILAPLRNRLIGGRGTCAIPGTQRLHREGWAIVLARLTRKLRGVATRGNASDDGDERPDPDMTEWERMDDEDDVDGRPTQ